MIRKQAIPRGVRRQVLIEAGYRCSITHCTADSALEFHHIDGNPDNNSAKNILVICSNHHRAYTSGRIDRKACYELKKALTQREIRIDASHRSLSSLLRQVLREELNSQSKLLPRKSDKGIFPSIFDRKYLFRLLDGPGDPLSYEIYMSIRVLGELKYRGSTKRIIHMIESMRDSSQRRKPRDFFLFYRAAIQSLSKISTRESLNWLADELIRSDQDFLHQFILYMAIGGAKKSRDYLGFKIISQKTEPKADREVHRISFLLRRGRGELVFKSGPPISA